MARARHYATANFLWNNVAYVDQWEKVMAVYDERNILRVVVKQIDDDICSVLLIGDDTQRLYFFDDVELGSTGKNMEACFKLYCRLQYLENPGYIPSYRRSERIEIYQVFPHTRVSARRTGGFHVTTEDLGDKIAKALKRYDELIASGVEELDCIDDDDYDGYPDTIYGEYGKMTHVGNGAYCDDDGDNWDFL